MTDTHQHTATAAAIVLCESIKVSMLCKSEVIRQIHKIPVSSYVLCPSLFFELIREEDVLVYLTLCGCVDVWMIGWSGLGCMERGGIWEQIEKDRELEKKIKCAKILPHDSQPSIIRGGESSSSVSNEQATTDRIDLPRTSGGRSDLTSTKHSESPRDQYVSHYPLPSNTNIKHAPHVHLERDPRVCVWCARRVCGGVTGGVKNAVLPRRREKQGKDAQQQSGKKKPGKVCIGGINGKVGNGRYSGCVCGQLWKGLDRDKEPKPRSKDRKKSEPSARTGTSARTGPSARTDQERRDDRERRQREEIRKVRRGQRIELDYQSRIHHPPFPIPHCRVRIGHGVFVEETSDLHLQRDRVRQWEEREGKSNDGIDRQNWIRSQQNEEQKKLQNLQEEIAFRSTNPTSIPLINLSQSFHNDSSIVQSSSSSPSVVNDDSLKSSGATTAIGVHGVSVVDGISEEYPVRSLVISPTFQFHYTHTLAYEYSLRQIERRRLMNRRTIIPQELEENHLTFPHLRLSVRNPSLSIQHRHIFNSIRRNLNELPQLTDLALDQGKHGVVLGYDDTSENCLRVHSVRVDDDHLYYALSQTNVGVEILNAFEIPYMSIVWLFSSAYPLELRLNGLYNIMSMCRSKKGSQEWLVRPLQHIFVPTHIEHAISSKTDLRKERHKQQQWLVRPLQHIFVPTHIEHAISSKTDLRKERHKQQRLHPFPNHPCLFPQSSLLFCMFILSLCVDNLELQGELAECLCIFGSVKGISTHLKLMHIALFKSPTHSLLLPHQLSLLFSPFHTVHTAETILPPRFFSSSSRKDISCEVFSPLFSRKRTTNIRTTHHATHISKIMLRDWIAEERKIFNRGNALCVLRAKRPGYFEAGMNIRGERSISHTNNICLPFEPHPTQKVEKRPTVHKQQPLNPELPHYDTQTSSSGEKVESPDLVVTHHTWSMREIYGLSLIEMELCSLLGELVSSNRVEHKLKEYFHRHRSVLRSPLLLFTTMLVSRYPYGETLRRQLWGLFGEPGDVSCAYNAIDYFQVWDDCVLPQYDIEDGTVLWGGEEAIREEDDKRFLGFVPRTIHPFNQNPICEKGRESQAFSTERDRIESCPSHDYDHTPSISSPLHKVTPVDIPSDLIGGDSSSQLSHAVQSHSQTSHSRVQHSGWLCGCVEPEYISHVISTFCREEGVWQWKEGE
ncbi:hypothetical protein ADUPG1_007126, partial [Aduncisulcus paluster]